MKKTSILVLSFLISLFSSCAHRAYHPDSTSESEDAIVTEEGASSPSEHPLEPARLSVEEQVTMLFHDYGIRRQLDTNMNATRELYNQLLNVLPPESKEAQKIGAERFDNEIVLHLIKNHALAHLNSYGDQSKLAGVIEWNRSEAGKKWLQATLDGLDGPEIDENHVRKWLDDFYRDLDSDPDKQDRLEAIMAIEEVSSHGERGIYLVLSLAEIVLDSFSTMLPDPIKPLDEHAGTIMQNLLFAMQQPSLMKALLDGYLYATRDFTIEELKMVASFHADGPGLWYLDLVDGAQKVAGQSYAQALTANLVDAWEELEGEN